VTETRRVRDATLAPPDLPERASSRWLTWLALGLVAVAGGLCLALPFWGDQALFTIYAREMTHGAVLYRDVFDVKQPGIFLFYAIGGSLFGFTEVGIHFFELLYWLAFSAFALKVLPRYFATRWAPALIPVFTIVVYYFHAGLLDLTQIEILVAFPILAAWWLIDTARPDTKQGIRRYAAAGLVAAAIVLLKHLYVAIVLVYLAAAIVRARRDGTSSREIGRCVGAFSIGVATPLLLVVAYFAVYGQLGRIWWAYFELSARGQLIHPKPLSYLTFGGRRFLIGHGPVLILAAAGVGFAIREREQMRSRLVAGMVWWLVVGAIAFLLQGWPEYKWSLFTVPVGILAAVGCDRTGGIDRGISRRRVALLALCAGLAALTFIAAIAPRVQTILIGAVVAGCVAGVGLPFASSSMRRRMTPFVAAMLAISVGVAAVAPAQKVRALATHDLGLTVDARAELRRSLSYSYMAADHDLRALSRRGAIPGPLFVFGDPVLILRAHRPQAAPILGWGPEGLDLRAWRELASDLRADPPPYIVVDDYAGSIMRSRYPSIMEFIQARYHVDFVGAAGTWYVLTSAEPA
jgi:hypothetical protein